MTLSRIGIVAEGLDKYKNRRGLHKRLISGEYWIGNKNITEKEYLIAGDELKE